MTIRGRDTNFQYSARETDIVHTALPASPGRAARTRRAPSRALSIDFRKELLLVIAASVVTGLALGTAAYAVYHAAGLRAELLEIRDEVRRLREEYKDLLGAAFEVKSTALAYNPKLAPPDAGTIAAEIVKQSRLHGLAPGFVAAVIAAESGFRVNVVSARGAVGLMQLMPETARGLGIDPRDWRQNLAGGVRYLKMLVDRFGHVEVALAAYNAGPARISRAGPSRGGWPRATRAYVTKVMQAREG